MTQDQTHNKIVKHRVGWEYDYLMTDSYKSFRKKYPKAGVNRVLHRKIIYEASKKIAEVILKDSLGFSMPRSMGILIGVKRLHRYTDYNKSADYDKRIYHINPATQGFSYSLRWIKDKRKFDNCTTYMYNATDDLKRRYYEHIINKITDYQDSP